MTKLYGIYRGCIYEGGGCMDILFTSVSKAREYAISLVEKKQTEQDELEEYTLRTSPEDEGYIFNIEWSEKSENYWTNDSDCIAVQEFKLVE
jgi:hypothetical protein